MSADLPLTTHELATIKATAESALSLPTLSHPLVIAARQSLRLVAEIERLQEDRDKWMRAALTLDAERKTASP